MFPIIARPMGGFLWSSILTDSGQEGHVIGPPFDRKIADISAGFEEKTGVWFGTREVHSTVVPAISQKSLTVAPVAVTTRDLTRVSFSDACSDRLRRLGRWSSQGTRGGAPVRRQRKLMVRLVAPLLDPAGQLQLVER